MHCGYIRFTHPSSSLPSVVDSPPQAEQQMGPLLDVPVLPSPPPLCHRPHPVVVRITLTLAGMPVPVNVDQTAEEPAL